MIPEEPAPTDPVQVLFVVDDDPALVESLADLLSDEGYRMEGFTDPAEALARLRGGARPAALLLDYLMPSMTGEQFLRSLAEVNVDVPVLLLSGLTDPYVGSLRVSAVLSKPIDLDRLLSEIALVAPAARATAGQGGAYARSPAGGQRPR